MNLSFSCTYYVDSHIDLCQNFTKIVRASGISHENNVTLGSGLINKVAQLLSCVSFHVVSWEH